MCKCVECAYFDDDCCMAQKLAPKVNPMDESCKMFVKYPMTDVEAKRILTKVRVKIPCSVSKLYVRALERAVVALDEHKPKIHTKHIYVGGIKTNAIICTNCNNQVSPTWVYCPQCGATILGLEVEDERR